MKKPTDISEVKRQARIVSLAGRFCADKLIGRFTIDNVDGRVKSVFGGLEISAFHWRFPGMEIFAETRVTTPEFILNIRKPKPGVKQRSVRGRFITVCKFGLLLVDLRFKSQSRGEIHVTELATMQLAEMAITSRNPKRFLTGIMEWLVDLTHAKRNEFLRVGHAACEAEQRCRGDASKL